MASVTPSLSYPKSRERERFKENGRGIELAVPPKQRRRDWQDGESETGPDELLRQLNIETRGQSTVKARQKRCRVYSKGRTEEVLRS